MFGSVYIARGMRPIQPSPGTAEVGGNCSTVPVSPSVMRKLSPSVMRKRSLPLERKMRLTLDAQPIPASLPGFVPSAGSRFCAARGVPNAKERSGRIVRGEQGGNHEGAEFKLAS